MRNSDKLRNLKILGGMAVAAGVAALASSCGGGGSSDGGGNATATTIDTTSVNSAITDFGGSFGICKQAGANALRSMRSMKLIPALLQGGVLLQGPALNHQTERPQALGSTAPADVLGSCGGRYGYRGYSHVSGVTTAALSFESYCQLDSSTGEKQTMNGGIAFINTATPTDSGPITTQLDAHTTSTLSTVTLSSAGSTVSSDSVNFTAFKMVVGVPGGTPTLAKPNVMSVGDITVANNITGKSYRQTGYAMTQYESNPGNTAWTVSGRGYRSGGTYFDVATTAPLVQNSTSGMVSGKFTFTGANGSNAVATIVPGQTLQTTLTVNGTPVTAVPTCVAAQ